jgi:lysophospholipase L1-like esterase
LNKRYLLCKLQHLNDWFISNRMKMIRRPLILAAFLLCFMIRAGAVEQVIGKIQVHHKERLLAAPEAVSYQWYYNGKKLLLTGREIRVMADGTYAVEIRDDRGNTEILETTVETNGEGKIYRIYILGDSTAANWSVNYYPQAGWGQVLKYFFTSSVVIENKALSARSAKSFYNDHWAPIREVLNPGDYVFIQFGINDAKSDDTARYTDPFTTFQDYLSLFIAESKARGAYPVLLTTVRRNAWNATQPPTLYDSYHDYPVATRKLAGELNVPLIDLDQTAKTLMESLGPDYTGPFMYLVLDTGEYAGYPTGKADQVHFQEMGAIEMARLVTETISGFDSDTMLNKLIPYIKPAYEVAVSTNFPEGAMITRTASYPEGIPVTLKAKLDPAYDLLEWIDESGKQVSKNDRFTFVMGNKATSYTALLDDDPVPDCSGEYNGSAFVDDCGDCVEGNTRLKPCCIELPDDTFKITSVASQLCLQEVTLEGEENSFIGLKPCLDNESQLWVLAREGNDYSIKNLASGLFLYAGSLTLITFLSTYDEEMLWRIEKDGTDTFRFVPADQWQITMEIYGSSLEEGYYSWLSGRKDNLNQLFAIHKNDRKDCTIYPDLCTGVLDNKISPDPAFYPNPFSNQAFLAWPDREKDFITFQLFDMNGNQITAAERIMGNKLPAMGNLPSGFYLAKIIFGEALWTIKVLKR